MFDKVTQEHIDILKEAFWQMPGYNSDYCAANCYGWQPIYNIELALEKGQVFLRFDHREYGKVYLAPAGGDIGEGIEFLKEYALSLGERQIWFLCEKPQLEYFQGARVIDARALYDYIHLAQNVVKPEGNRFRHQRQQEAQFFNTYKGVFEPLELSGARVVEYVNGLWSGAREQTQSVKNELIYINRLLSAAGRLELILGVLFADGKPAGVAIGSFMRSDVLDIHVEKADVAYKGVYAALRGSFARYAFSKREYRYINREDDMGIENLRQAKLRLKPEFLAEKYFVQVGF